MTEQITPADIACSLSDEEFRERRALVRETVVSKVLRTERTVSGLKVRFPNTEEMKETVQQFVELERECCGLLSFSLDKSGSELELEIAGPSSDAKKTLDFFAHALTEK